MKLCGLLPCYLWVIFSQGDCRQAIVTITPQSLTLQPNQSDTGGTVTITCQASGVKSGDILIVMNIIRSVGNMETPLVTSSSNNNDAALEPGTGLTGASVSGGITQGSPTSTMTLTLTQAKCDHNEGMYTCKITILQRQPVITQDYINDKNLSIQVSPGPVLLTPSPTGTTSWTVGDTLVMTCNAPVGTVEDDTEIQWVWQWRNTQSKLIIFWIDYDGDPTHIEEGLSTQQTCYQRRVSILTRQLTEDDNNRVYRCYIRRRQGQAAFEDFDQYAGVHAVGTVSQAYVSTNGGTTITTTRKVNPNENVSTNGGVTVTAASDVISNDNATVYKAVSIALGSVLIVVIISVLFFFLWLSRRGWIGPCADGDKQDVSQGHEKTDRNAAAVSTADYLEPMDYPPGFQAPSGPYESLNMPDVGKKNVYVEMNNLA